jgi:hypothetical protein
VELQMLEFENKEINITMKETALKGRLLKTVAATFDRENDIDKSRLELHKKLSTMRVANRKNYFNDDQTRFHDQTGYNPVLASRPFQETTAHIQSHSHTKVAED